MQTALISLAIEVSGIDDMRVYFFCPETGLYQGEGYQDFNQTDSFDGVTEIAPPEYHKGEVPVFDTETGSWHLRHISHCRKLITDKDPA